MSAIGSYSTSSSSCRLSSSIPSEEKSNDLSSTQTNAALAAISGFVSRLFLERILFQNTQIPPDLCLHLANDLIDILTPKKRETLNMAKELSLLWKECKAASLTEEEEDYLDSPLEIDVLNEIFNGLKYSSMALMGQGFYESVTSAMTQRLWNHVPAICGYFGAAWIGPQTVVSAINQCLQRMKMTPEQKVLVEPWLHMVGRLAIGLIPKVHATEEGVYYRYPSTEGYSRIVGPHQTTTRWGEKLSIERAGNFSTPEGTFEGVHEVDFKLSQIEEWQEERVRIQIADKEGNLASVTFTKIAGVNGPEIHVSSNNKDLEAYWSAYFPKTQLQLSDLENRLSTRDKLSLQQQISAKHGLAVGEMRAAPLPPLVELNIQDPHFAILSIFCLIGGLAKAGKSHDFPLASQMAVLLALSLPKSIQAGSPMMREAFPLAPFARKGGLGDFIGDIFFPRKSFKEALERSGHEARLILDRLDQVIKGAVHQVEGGQNQFLMDLGEKGILLIHTEGDALKITADKIAENTQMTLEVGGWQAKCILEAAGQEARAKVFHLEEKVRLTIREASGEANELSGKAERDASRVVLNFGEEGRLTIQELGKEVRLTTSDALKHLIKGSRATLHVAGHEMCLMAQEVGLETHLIIQEAGKEDRYIVDATGNVAMSTPDHLQRRVSLTIDHGKGAVIETIQESENTLVSLMHETIRMIGMSRPNFVSQLLDGICSYMCGPTELPTVSDAERFKEMRVNEEKLKRFLSVGTLGEDVDFDISETLNSYLRNGRFLMKIGKLELEVWRDELINLKKFSALTGNGNVVEIFSTWIKQLDFLLENKDSQQQKRGDQAYLELSECSSQQEKLAKREDSPRALFSSPPTTIPSVGKEKETVLKTNDYLLAAFAQLELQNQLTQACYDADIGSVRDLIEKKLADPFMPDKNGQQPLAAAIWGLSLNVMDYLETKAVLSLKDWVSIAEFLQSKYGQVILSAPTGKEEDVAYRNPNGSYNFRKLVVSIRIENADWVWSDEAIKMKGGLVSLNQRLKEIDDRESNLRGRYPSPYDYNEQNSQIAKDRAEVISEFTEWFNERRKAMISRLKDKGLVISKDNKLYHSQKIKS